MPKLNYKPSGSIARKFLKDDTFVRGIRGPVGSGKSAACCIHIFQRALQQEPAPDGIRYTKWAIIRNTNPELRTTTIATWLQWFPENEWGSFRWSPPFTHHIRVGDIDLEVLFLPLDTPEDVKKLLSLELTGVWVNEAREVPKAIIDAATSRVGRYPSKKDGVGATWSGVILDTNAPEEDHWWPVMSGETDLPDHIPEEQALMLVKPDNWKFFTQPSGMIEMVNEDGSLVGYEINPAAENIENLPPKYYDNMIRGKTRGWIDVYVMNRLGAINDGKGVYTGFSEKTHISKEPLEPFVDSPIIIGLDFGLTPAAVFCQRLSNSRWMILRELVCADMGAKRFGAEVKRTIGRFYPEHEIEVWGDPSGDFRAQTDETTPFQILRAGGLLARPGPTNDPIIRIESVSNVLGRMVDGNPGFLVDRSACPILSAGFLGGYHYRRMQVSGDRYEDKPNKNKYSHVHDALQYAFTGAGEGRELLRGKKPQRSFVAGSDYNPFKRLREKKRFVTRTNWV